ncbi:MAG: hypothetical protein WC465_02845 [Patescibacteria group bacterium]
MADDKKINLMPENLRGKEESFKPKSGLHLSPDLSLPGKTFSQPKGRPSGSDVSFWSKLIGVFGAKSKKVSIDQSPKVKQEMTGPAHDFEIPKFDSPIMTAKTADFKMPKNGPEVRPGITNKAKVEESGSKPSFWQILAKFFQGKPKIPKVPQPKKTNGSILANSAKKNGFKPEIEMRMPKSEPAPKVLQELNRPAVTENKVEDILEVKTTAEKVIAPIPEPEIKFVPEKKPEPLVEPIPVAPVIEKKENNFIIPEISATKAAKPEAPSVELSSAKFHQPSVRDKGRLLGNGNGIDLVPTAARVRSWLQISGLLFLSILASVIVLALFYGALYLQEKDIARKQKVEQEKITEIEKNILNFTELNKNISDLGAKIKLVQETLNKHIYWTNFFALLEKYTLPDVFYSGLAAGNNGALTLSATASSYDSVAKQLKILEDSSAQEFVTSVRINSAKQGENGNVSFTINLVLNPKLFYYSPTDNNGQ